MMVVPVGLVGAGVLGAEVTRGPASAKAAALAGSLGSPGRSTRPDVGRRPLVLVRSAGASDGFEPGKGGTHINTPHMLRVIASEAPPLLVLGCLQTGRTA